MQHIVLSLLLRHDAADSNHQNSSIIPAYRHVSDYAPFFEIDAHWDRNDLASWIQANHQRLGRRVFNTHLRWDMLPSDHPENEEESSSSGGGGSSKFIYIVRSPLDVCVSFFFHLSHQVEGGFAGSFDEFFMDWVDGKVAFGTWMDHVLSYLPAFSDQESESTGRRQFLLVSYDEMLQDLPTVLQKLVVFLELNVGVEEQRALLPSFSFDHMKVESDRFQPKSVAWKNQFSFLRRGISGDASSMIMEDQRRLFAEHLQARDFKKLVTDGLGIHSPMEKDTILRLLNGCW